MSTISSTHPKVDVLHWGASHVSIRCPYCEETHHHSPGVPRRHASHCEPSGQYGFVFPIDTTTGLVGYEIDKRRALFVNVEYEDDHDDDEQDEEDGEDEALADSFCSKMILSNMNGSPESPRNFKDDGGELPTLSLPDGGVFEKKRSLLILADCVDGVVIAVNRYLDVSNEGDLFLHGRDRTGNTTLIQAASGKSPGMVQLLVQRGADIEATNEMGRTAVMEAALWGRLDSVKILLNASASKDTRDRKGRRAVDLAQPIRKNEKERYALCDAMAAERVLEHDANRRHIAILLGTSTLNRSKREVYSAPLTVIERAEYAFIKSEAESTISLHGPVTVRDYYVRDIRKTVAELHRGTQFACISATSGWAAYALPESVEDWPSWVVQVFYIASIVGHQLYEHEGWDQGTPGKHFACHAEKKLIAYFIDKHVFTPRDRDQDEELEVTLSELESLIVAARDACPNWDKVCTLEEKKAALNCEHFEEDGEYKDNLDKDQIKRLKKEISAIGTEIIRLEAEPDVAEMRDRQERRDTLVGKVMKHQSLMDMCRAAPADSLKSAVILSSTAICIDCETFKNKVNGFFDLDIEMQHV